MRCFVRRRRVVKRVERRYLDRPGDRQRHGGGGQRSRYPGRLLHHQAQERDQHVHRQPGRRRSDGRPRRSALQRDLGGLQGESLRPADRRRLDLSIDLRDVVWPEEKKKNKKKNRYACESPLAE